MICEVTVFTFMTLGALVLGVFVGWAGGFLTGIFWRVK